MTSITQNECVKEENNPPISVGNFITGKKKPNLNVKN